MASSVCTCGNSSASLCGYGLVKSPAIRRVRTGDGGNAQLPWQRLPKNCTETKRMTALTPGERAEILYLVSLCHLVPALKPSPAKSAADAIVQIPSAGAPNPTLKVWCEKQNDHPR